MNKLSFYTYRTLLWIWDIISLNIVLFILSITVSRANALNERDYYFFFTAINMFWMGSVFVTALYLSKNWLDIQNFIKETMKSYLLTVLATLFFIFISKTPYSRLYIVLTFGGFALALMVNRIIFYFFVQALRNNDKLAKNVVVVGYNDISKRLIRYFQQETKLVKLLGCFEEVGRIKDEPVLPILGDFSQIMAFSKSNNVTEIYSTIAPETNAYMYELAREAENHFIRFKFVPDYQIFVNRNIFVDFVDDIPVLSLRKEPLEDTGSKIKKRVFDIFFSLFVIIFILSWLVPIIAILIKLESRGPVFFIQERSGKNNQPFSCLKFRSLKMNDEANKKQVTKNDSRVTRVGRILRKTNLDELPQFFNVFMGDMSVVGPRPHMLKHTDDFTAIYKEYMIRHFVKPGLTGWAQVNGFRGEIRENEMLRKRVEYDIWYMENWSLWLDMKIIIMTIYVTVRGDKNAY
jgi:putative colanic acid biosynthesis UDP-glucose lipid carrier transferase